MWHVVRYSRQIQARRKVQSFTYTILQFHHQKVTYGQMLLANSTGRGRVRRRLKAIARSSQVTAQGRPNVPRHGVECLECLGTSGSEVEKGKMGRRGMMDMLRKWDDHHFTATGQAHSPTCLCYFRHCQSTAQLHANVPLGPSWMWLVRFGMQVGSPNWW